MNSALGTLETRVRALETTSRSEAEPSKRRRNDEDDPSRHEEEADKPWESLGDWYRDVYCAPSD